MELEVFFDVFNGTVVVFVDVDGGVVGVGKTTMGPIVQSRCGAVLKMSLVM